MTYNCTYPLKSLLSIEIYILLVLVLFMGFLILFTKSDVFIQRTRSSVFGILLMVSGGVYNLYYRYAEGCVRDPYPFFGLFSFNLADILIIIGLVILLTNYIITLKGSSKND